MRHIRGSTLLISLFASHFLFAQTRGAITATVVDETGNALPAATLYAQPEGMLLMAVASCSTDANGSCTVSNLDFGPYFVYAGKPEDGYPDLVPFYQPRGTRCMETTLSEDHPTDNMFVHVGPKAGILKGTVADAVTGKSLSANVEFRWVSDPENFLTGSLSTNPAFRVLIPSRTAVAMVVSLDGYENWTYGVDGHRGKSLLLEPGQEETLEIRLRPKSR